MKKIFILLMILAPMGLCAQQLQLSKRDSVVYNVFSSFFKDSLNKELKINEEANILALNLGVLFKTKVWDGDYLSGLASAQSYASDYWDDLEEYKKENYRFGEVIFDFSPVLFQNDTTINKCGFIGNIEYGELNAENPQLYLVEYLTTFENYNAVGFYTFIKDNFYHTIIIFLK